MLPKLSSYIFNLCNLETIFLLHILLAAQKVSYVRFISVIVMLLVYKREEQRKRLEFGTPVVVILNKSLMSLNLSFLICNECLSSWTVRINGDK